MCNPQPLGSITWMIWEHSQELFDEFLKKLNGIHPKIKWEAVFEVHGQLPFLGVLVVRNENCLDEKNCLWGSHSGRR